jgi:hypothetical protein
VTTVSRHFTVTASGPGAEFTMPDKFTLTVEDGHGRRHRLEMRRDVDDPALWVSTKPIRWDDVRQVTMPAPLTVASGLSIGTGDSQ